MLSKLPFLHLPGLPTTTHLDPDSSSTTLRPQENILTSECTQCSASSSSRPPRREEIREAWDEIMRVWSSDMAIKHIEL